MGEHGHCECDCEDKENENLSMDEVVYNNNLLVNALVDLLIEKKIISEEEFEAKLDEMDSEDEDAEDESSEEEAEEETKK